MIPKKLEKITEGKYYVEDFYTLKDGRRIFNFYATNAFEFT